MRLIFTPSFNKFQQINATQAWSLFTSACKRDDSLGTSPMIGKYVTVFVVGAIAAQIIEIILNF